MASQTPSGIPDISEADVDREELEEAAEAVGLDDHGSMSDQELLAAVGYQLGEVSEDELAEVAGQDTQGAVERTSEGGPSDEDERVADQDGSPEQRPDGAEGATDGEEMEPPASESGASEEDERARSTADEPSRSEERGKHQAPPSHEYQVEDDEREGARSVLDLEVGPLALDLLGLEVHLSRLHTSVVANRGPDHAILGKVLAVVATATDKLGLGVVTGKVTDGVQRLFDLLPTPSLGGGDDGGSSEGESEETTDSAEDAGGDGYAEPAHDDEKLLGGDDGQEETAAPQAAEEEDGGLIASASGVAKKAVSKIADAVKAVGRPVAGVVDKARNAADSAGDTVSTLDTAKDAVTKSASAAGTAKDAAQSTASAVTPGD